MRWHGYADPEITAPMHMLNADERYLDMKFYE
jgi:hypothetical protein